MLVQRSSDVQLNSILLDAPAEFDTFAEVSSVLAGVKAKMDLISISSPINLDNISNIGSILDFENSLL